MKLFHKHNFEFVHPIYAINQKTGQPVLYENLYQCSCGKERLEITAEGYQLDNRIALNNLLDDWESKGY